MLTKIKKDVLLFSILFVFFSLLQFIFNSPRITSAQIWGLSNTWTQPLFWSPYQNPIQTAWQNPWQNQWTSPFQNQWQSQWQSPFQGYWQNAWQSSWQNPFQNQWQNPWQSSWQNPWQQPFQNPWQNQWQYPLQQAQYQSADIDLDSGDDGDSINVKVGDTISIILESNSSTGYKWVLATNTLDSAIVSNTSSKYFSGVTSLVGAVGTEQWIFEAEAPGTTTIKLNYKRIWETSIEDTFEVEVTVEE